MDSSGLKLISSYNGDEEDEPVEASGSEEGSINSRETELHMRSPKLNSRLPLPSSILQLFNSGADVNQRLEDDPKQHEGRIRSFPHQRGNWATYVYVPYETDDDFMELLLDLKKCVSSRLLLNLQPVQDPHISLTRTVVLLHHWIDGFINSVKSKLSHLPRFDIILGPPSIYCNEEKTRTFVGLQVQTGVEQLTEAAHSLDQCLSEFRLPPFYKDPSFHMSVLWLVGDSQKELEDMLPQLNAVFDAFAVSSSHSLVMNVTHCCCKTGNKSFTFPLAFS